MNRKVKSALKNKRSFRIDWSLLLAILLLILVILRSDRNSALMWTYFRQFLILAPGILGEMIFLIAGRVDLSVGGTIVLLKQILSYLVLFRNLPVLLSAALSFADLYTFSIKSSVISSIKKAYLLE